MVVGSARVGLVVAGSAKEGWARVAAETAMVALLLAVAG